MTAVVTRALTDTTDLKVDLIVNRNESIAQLAPPAPRPTRRRWRCLFPWYWRTIPITPLVPPFGSTIESLRWVRESQKLNPGRRVSLQSLTGKQDLGSGAFTGWGA